MLRKIINRITGVNILLSEIEKLKALVAEQEIQINKLISDNTLLQSFADKMTVIEGDRDELFKRLDMLTEKEETNANQSSILKEEYDVLLNKIDSLDKILLEVYDRIGVVEADRDELFRRLDLYLTRISEMSDRIGIIEEDRKELFKRSDLFETSVLELSDKVDVIQCDRDELFNRFDKTVESISVLEKDRTELFSRIDEVRTIIDKNRFESKEDVWAAEIAIRDSLDNLHQMIHPQKVLPRVHFIRTLDIENVGDKNCGPYEYFKKEFSSYNCIFHTLKEVRFDLIKKDDYVILGGDGMLECSKLFSDTINEILKKCNHVIGWAIGHNKHYERTVLFEADIPNVDLNSFELLAIRDYNYSTNERYCPCVSCMMSGLGEKYQTRRKVGVISHHHFIINDFENYEHLTNSDNLEDILRFIGESEVIITNTYHCAYWSTLMGKKVILYKPFSEKFFYYKHSPVIYSGNLEKDIAEAKNYTTALQECRELNIQLMREVISLIEQGRV